MDKNQLRKALRKKRRAIPQDKKVIYDNAISEKIIISDYFKNAHQVLVFSSTDNEFDTSIIISQCRRENKHIFYPVCKDDKGNMSFYRCDSDDDLQIGMYSIPEPKAYCEEYKPQKNDIVIVPCLSIDKNFYRIGYGKGYYDRFLQNFNGISICPCYEELITECLPTDKNDIKVDIIVTENFMKEGHL